MCNQCSRESMLCFDCLWNWNVWIDVFDEPAEWSTIEFLTQLNLLADVAKVSLLIADCLVVIFLVVVEPDLGQPVRVPTVSAFSFGKLKEKVAKITKF